MDKKKAQQESKKYLDFWNGRNSGQTYIGSGHSLDDLLEKENTGGSQSFYLGFVYGFFDTTNIPDGCKKDYSKAEKLRDYFQTIECELEEFGYI